MSRGNRSKKDKYRSDLERKVASQLKDAEYETLKIPYVVVHKYVPDFILPNGIILEVKGRFVGKDRAKHLQIRKQQPDLDIRFVFGRDQTLNKKSNTYYSEWCDKHGFLYSTNGVVPKAWLKEKKCKLTVLDAASVTNSQE